MTIDETIAFLNLLRETKPTETIRLSILQDQGESEELINHIKGFGYFCFAQITASGEEVVIVGKKS